MNNLNLNEIEGNALPTFRFRGATIGELVSAALPYIFFFAGLIFVFEFIMGGFRLLTAAGDPKAIAGAKSMLTHALIGLLIVFIAFWIVQIIAIILGLDPILDVF